MKSIVIALCVVLMSLLAVGGDTGPETRTTAAMLRVRNDASQLCRMCHTDHTKGRGFGTHPTGGMPWSVPDEWVAAGAKVGPDPKRLICQTCHTPHGSREEHLLVMGTESNQLCLTCHKNCGRGCGGRSWCASTRGTRRSAPKRSVMRSGTWGLEPDRARL